MDGLEIDRQFLRLIDTNAVRPGSGPIFAILMARFWPNLMVGSFVSKNGRFVTVILLQ